MFTRKKTLGNSIAKFQASILPYASRDFIIGSLRGPRGPTYKVLGSVGYSGFYNTMRALIIRVRFGDFIML